GKQETRGVERIEEPERVADEAPTVAGRLFRPVRVFLLNAEDIAAGGALQPRLQARRTRDLFEVKRFGVLGVAIPEQIVRVRHHADADNVVAQRDVPEPALLP